MNKTNSIYIIQYSDETNGEYSSGISYVFDTLEKAIKQLETIKQDEIILHIENGIKDIKNFITSEEQYFYIEYCDEFLKYEIIEKTIE